MVDIAFYLVTESIARRSGVIDSRYRIADGRFVLDNKDLSYIRFTTDEYISGLSGVTMIDKQDAMILIQENHYAMGLPVNDNANVNQNVDVNANDNDNVNVEAEQEETAADDNADYNVNENENENENQEEE